MFIDALFNFIAPGAPVNFTALTGYSTNPVDILGLGVGVSPGTQGQGLGGDIIGNTTVFGDPDAGGTSGFHPEIWAAVGTAFTTGTSATLNMQLQGAPDNGSSQPGTWQTYIETGTITAANLTANQVLKLPFMLPFPPNNRPRFLRLNFSIPATETFTAGTLANAIVTTLRDDYQAKYAVNNFVAP